jgi:hypothetical protein
VFTDETDRAQFHRDRKIKMSIDPFLTGQAFDSKAIREMSLSMESVCNALGVAPEDRAARRLVAEKIIELAGHGMRGATLHATAAKAVEVERRKVRE